METEFKVGDKIEITEVGENSKDCFSAGDIGLILKYDGDNRYSVDFNNQGNKKVVENGIWYVKNSIPKWYGAYAQFKLYQGEEEKPRLHAAQPGDLLWNDDLGICEITRYGANKIGPKTIWIKKVDNESFSDIITLDGKRYLESPKATFFYYTPEDHYLTERPEPEVDWSKASGAKVKVCDVINDKEAEQCIFAFYKPELEYCFWVYDVDRDDIVYGYKYCSLAEPCKPEWRK